MIKNPIKRLLYVPKHSKPVKKSPFIQMFLCILSMTFFISCFASITWAWFSDTATSGVIPITSAKYNVEVTVFDSSNNKIDYDKNGSYSLDRGAYKISMKAEGTATKISGYCKLVIGSSEYYSPRLKAEKLDGSKDVHEITFDLKLNEASVISFSSSWEAYPNGEIKIIDVNKGITYGKEPVIDEDKKQDEDNSETDKSQEDIIEDNNQDGIDSEIENPPSEENESSPEDVESDKSEDTPAFIEENKKEEQKNSDTENSQDNNKKSSDPAVKSPEATTDGTSEIVDYEDNEGSAMTNGD